MIVQIDNQHVYKTPMELITDLSWTYIKAHGFYEKGFLPNGKGWNEESNKVIQAISTLDNEFNKWRNTRSKRP